ncbi:MAG: metallophosphoesterase [Lachnospiraceae bacterium]
MKILVFIVVIILLILCECIRELRRFKITHYTVTSAKLSELSKEKKVILLSDLHNHCYGKNNADLIQAIQNQQPDIILIAGDMLVGKKGESVEIAASLIERLPNICPVCYGNGNHEQRMKEHPEKYGDTYVKYKKRLQASGVIFLENNSRIRMMDETVLEIYGLELPMTCYEKFKKEKLMQKTMVKCLGTSNANLYQILIAHNPIYFEAYRTWGADLVVSGHLHGGVARIPGWRGVITPQGFLFPPYSGEKTTKEQSTIVVSKGLGTHTVNLRLCNPAEVVVIHLQSEEK